MNILIYEPKDYYLKQCTDLIKEYLHSNQQEATILAKQTFEELLPLIEEGMSTIDLLYLSVESVSDLKQVELIRNLGYQREIILYSHQKDFAVDGYDNEVLNYIVKDQSSLEKFELALSKAFQKCTNRQKEGVVLSRAGTSKYLLLEDINYFESQSRIITVHYDKDKTFEFYTTMGKLEEQFYQRGFIRIHRSFLINKRYIAKTFATKVVLITGVELPVGRRYKKNLMVSEEKP